MNTVDSLSGLSMEMFRTELSGLLDRVTALEATYERVKDESIEEENFTQAVTSLTELVESVREVMLALQQSGGMSLVVIPINVQGWRTGIEQARRERGIAASLERERLKRAADFARKEQEEQDKLERLRRGEEVPV